MSLLIGLSVTTLVPAQVVLTGIGTATIDGVINSAEWAQAGSMTISGISEPGTSTTTSATIYAMNDATNLYLAVNIDSWHTDPVAGGSVAFAFINSGVGNSFSLGDNIFVYNAYWNILYDDYALSNSSSNFDLADGGTANGTGAYTSGANTAYEISFPLNSGDTAHDFSLVTGQSVLFKATIQLAVYSIPGDSSSTWSSASTITPVFTQFTVSSVPEPSAYAALFGLTTLGVAAYRRRK